MKQVNWQKLYGDFSSHGVSLRRVCSDNSSQWASVLEEGAIHLFMNLEGTSLVFGQSVRLPMFTKTIGVCHVGKVESMLATYVKGDMKNEIIVLCVTPEWIRKNFGVKKEYLYKDVTRLLAGETPESMLLSKVRYMSYLEYELCSSIMNPPVHKEAKSFWFLAKIIELLSIHLFKPPGVATSERFCSNQKRVAKERIDKVLIWLEEHLDEPLDLKALANFTHCSSSYLSRLFSKNTGTTISKKLRSMRVERAAELLTDGDYNVTESAMEVGYNSLSHFTKAFQEEKGMTPSLYVKYQQVNG